MLSTGELLLDAVYFMSGKTFLSDNSKPYLNIIGKMLLKYPKLQIEAKGHTDNIGAKLPISFSAKAGPKRYATILSRSRPL